MEETAEESLQGNSIVIPRSSVEQIRLSVRDYRGCAFADLRLFSRNDAGEWKPSKRGLAVSPDIWWQFVDGVQRLGEEMERRGLLEQEEAGR